MINKVLVIIAHQDDEAIGCGGSIRKWADEGKDIEVVFVTDGKTGIDYNNDENHIVDKRQMEAEKAASILGFKVIFWDYECQAVENSRLLLCNLVERIRISKPDLILTHSAHDKHRDHQAVHCAVKEAAWKASEQLMYEFGEPFLVKDVWAMEIQDILKDVDFTVDITETLKDKLEAIKIYTSQKNIVNGISDFLQGLAMVRGYGINKKYGESFKRISSSPSGLI